MTTAASEVSLVGGETMKSYAIWNNKGGVGKTYLSFAMATEYARQHPEKRVIFADMCPQANLSEVLLGGNGTGAQRLADLIVKRNTVGGYFDRRTRSPHIITGAETSFLIPVSDVNSHIPKNVFLIAGDPSLEVQAQVINQLSSVNLPVDSWKTIHLWLRDLLVACAQQLGIDDTVCFIDCNPSFSAYTELSLLAANAIIIPCSSDGSSARAVDNLGQLVYGVGVQNEYRSVNFYDRCRQFGLAVPVIHSLVFNRSTEYDKRASKAFSAMFDEILARAQNLRGLKPAAFQGGELKTFTVPDNHSVAIVSSHLGRPLFDIKPGSYQIHDTNPQINPEPLERYTTAIEDLVSNL
ncbi:Septum formation inhibitor-activating ATPase [Serratia marcescens]|uniref:ParA family protein n=1 Tax=Serratia marcescens TaxID=615 RepID=UPI0007452A41|nr:ParA family protein [Serratia marcescens]CUY34516.1 Septum formation inhibitor-activating ATPase [Serratia marcescens]CUY94543.1 Septum formation inhibitor-activating ATPase [Serratia marcescens]CUZ00448.1 Septum formation inhibitor-activating ATPase [Serratia marcescens]CVG26185.1 Septum formation inhibitor-activating ATPase [Serratia marcescens]